MREEEGGREAFERISFSIFKLVSIISEKKDEFCMMYEKAKNERLERKEEKKKKKPL